MKPRRFEHNYSRITCIHVAMTPLYANIRVLLDSTPLMGMRHANDPYYEKGNAKFLNQNNSFLNFSSHHKFKSILCFPKVATSFIIVSE